MNKISPVLRYPGSKTRKIKEIIKILDIKNNDIFLDPFGGSGIVSVNVKHLVNCQVFLNDYDRNFVGKKLSISKAIKNQISYGGTGRSFTIAALNYFNRRIEQGYWNKFIKFNDILQKIEITHYDFKDFLEKTILKIENKSNLKIYLDPPYVGVKQLYKNNNINHEKLFNLLNKIHKDNPKSKIAISYGNHPKIKKLYKSWNIQYMNFSYRRQTKNECKNYAVKELLITNF